MHIYEQAIKPIQQPLYQGQPQQFFHAFLTRTMNYVLISLHSHTLQDLCRVVGLVRQETGSHSCWAFIHWKRIRDNGNVVVLCPRDPPGQRSSFLSLGTYTGFTRRCTIIHAVFAFRQLFLKRVLTSRVGYFGRKGAPLSSSMLLALSVMNVFVLQYPRELICINAHAIN